VVHKLSFYDVESLEKIARRTSSLFETPIDEKSIKEIGLRSRGTPRIVNRLFRRIRDFADVLNKGIIDHAITVKALDKLGIDPQGLDAKDFQYLDALVNQHKGGPVGIENLASGLSEDVTTLEDVYEPYLLKMGFIARTSRGRVATEKAFKHLKKPYQTGIFE